jgi:hypothetical protein
VTSHPQLSDAQATLPSPLLASPHGHLLEPWHSWYLCTTILEGVGCRSHQVRHGIKKGDVIHAIEFALLEFPLDSEPPHRVLRLGPDSAGNLLEVVTLMNRDGDVTAIHAMRMRRKYLELLGGGTLG